MNNIYVLSRAKFKEEIKNLSEQQFMSGAFISIHSPNVGMSFNDTEPILESSSNVLNLWFHDFDPESEINQDADCVVFDESMALEIKNFVLKNLNAKFWLIHCTAGVCRSGAVGEVLSEFFQISYYEFKRDNPQIKPNIYVKNLLKRITAKQLNTTSL